MAQQSHQIIISSEVELKEEDIRRTCQNQVTLSVIISDHLKKKHWVLKKRSRNNDKHSVSRKPPSYGRIQKEILEEENVFISCKDLVM